MSPYEYVQTAAKHSDVPILVSVGAELGNHETTFFCKVAPEGRIFAIEPDPRTFEHLAKLPTKFPNLCTHNFAISNTNGTHVFFQTGGSGCPFKSDEEFFNNEWTLASSLLGQEKMTPEGEFWPWMTCKQIVVPTMTLDTWAATNNVDHIDFLWVDVEGATHLLIEGGSNILAKTRYFYTEVRAWARLEGECLKPDVIRLLPDFELIEDYGQDILLRNKKLCTL